MRASLFDRWTYIGRTGKGKTFGAKQILHHAAKTFDAWQDPNAQILILKTKNPRIPDFTARDFSGTTYEAKRGVKAWRRSRARVIVVELSPKEWMSPKKSFELFYATVIAAAQGRRGKDLIVYTDEMTTITEGKTNGGGPNFKHIYQQGRGEHIGAHAGQQDASFIDRVMLSQVEHFLIWPLRMPTDRKKMSLITGIDLPEHYADEHGVWYSGPDGNLYVPDIRDLLWDIPT